MSNLVQIDDLADEISRLVSDYGKQCTETTKDCVNTVAKKTLQRIKQGSPEKTGKYKKGWKKTVVEENASRLVISIHDTKYSLVHLLEKGHKEIDDWQLAFKIANNNYKLMRAAEPIIKVENDILRKYGEKDENGELIASRDGTVKIVDTKKYGQDTKTLMETENDVEVEYFSKSEVSKMHITPNQIVLLMPIIE